MTTARKCPVCGTEHPAYHNPMVALCSNCWQSWFNRGGKAGEMLTALATGQTIAEDERHGWANTATNPPREGDAK